MNPAKLWKGFNRDYLNGGLTGESIRCNTGI